MYSSYDLSKNFCRANFPPHFVAANDDCVAPRDFFSEAQIAQLNALVMPYYNSGAITGFEYKKGHESSTFIVKDERQARNNVIFCVTVHAPQGQLVTYSPNVGRIKINAETINFQEVLRTARGAMETLFPQTQTPQPRFSLV